MGKNRMIALLTDFGLSDTYVGSLKGAIYSINPKAMIIDVCHTISPQNIFEGAYVLRCVYHDYPTGTIFVCVVDPGVGSERHPILVSAGSRFFVGPDNGIFSFIYQREKSHRIFRLTNPKYFRHPVSSTFHGRDIFAPVAAWFSQGVQPKQLGLNLKGKPVTLPAIEPLWHAGLMKGRIMRIDHFGNLMTNIHRNDLNKNPLLISYKGKKIPFKKFYAEGGARGRSLAAIISSSGFLEIAAACGSAQKILKAKIGDLFSVRLGWRALF